ncbi:hypothetical protein VOLCADRAFT_95436 [Volvox carteri f. nagariensis]|uniref:Uncharacterized protein n=1 Tax=Volvox carteri f. nagariensis TaxID=3068 RepID=D8U7G1_VOLCA|nr:uncharacterized protein VOLCADRAFT_95436 [Volvox carteri f. nagariensis]EFJ44230.1 hypothetical protein VOLCADRAFT_95436 [Volvox carteri f. nagariensis]|eukprot:XP_002954589.1 hypothetical protein VOLCADRAFT_95436 [Volvox carteri f. nagariensis]
MPPTQTRTGEVFAVCNASKRELLWIDDDDGVLCTRPTKEGSTGIIPTRRTSRGRVDPGYLYGMPSTCGLSSSRAQVGGVEYNSFFVNPLAEGSHDGGEPIPYAGAALGTTNALLGILCKGHNNPLADEYSELSYSSTPESSPAKVRIRAFAPRYSSSDCSCALDSGKCEVDFDSGWPASPGTPLLGPNVPMTDVLGSSSAASEGSGSLLPPAPCAPQSRQPYARVGKHFSEGPGSCKTSLGGEGSEECGRALQGVDKGISAAVEGENFATEIGKEPSRCRGGCSGESIDNDALREQHESDIEEADVLEGSSGGRAPIVAADHASAASDVCAPCTPPLAARDGSGGSVAAAGGLAPGPGRLGNRQAMSDGGNGGEKRLSEAPKLRSATSVPTAQLQVPQRNSAFSKREPSWRCMAASSLQLHFTPESAVVDVSSVLPRGADGEAQMLVSLPEAALLGAQAVPMEAAQLAQGVLQQQQQPSNLLQQLRDMRPAVPYGVVPSGCAALPSWQVDAQEERTVAQPPNAPCTVHAPLQEAAQPPPPPQQQASHLGLQHRGGTIAKHCAQPKLVCSLPEHFPSYFNGSQQLPSPPVLSPPATVTVTVEGEVAEEETAIAEPEVLKDLTATGPAARVDPPAWTPRKVLGQSSGGTCIGSVSPGLTAVSSTVATSASLTSLPSAFLPSVPAALFSSPFVPPVPSNPGKGDKSSRRGGDEEPVATNTTKAINASDTDLTAATPVCPVTPMAAQPTRAPAFPDPGCSISALAMTRMLIRQLGLLPLKEAPLLPVGGASQPQLRGCTTMAAVAMLDLPGPSPFAVAVSAAEAAMRCTEPADGNNEAANVTATLQQQNGSIQSDDIISLRESEHGREAPSLTCGSVLREADVATMRCTNKSSHVAGNAAAAAAATLEVMDLWALDTAASAAAGGSGGFNDDIFSVMTTTQESSALFDVDRGSCSLPCLLSARSMQGWLEPQGWKPLREKYCGVQHQQPMHHHELQYVGGDGGSQVTVM